MVAALIGLLAPASASSPAGSVQVAAIDMDGAGNSDTGVGTIDGCRTIGGVGQTLVIDIVLVGVPDVIQVGPSDYAGGIAGFAFALTYNPNVVHITDITVNHMTGAGTVDFSTFDDFDPPRLDYDGSFTGAAADFGAVESGDGRIARVTLLAVGVGGSPLTLDVTPPGNEAVTDGWSNTYDVSLVQSAEVHVAEPCSTLDADGDGVPDGSDNCPNWPNPSQGLPPWTVPSGDPDCDGFASAAETSITTDPVDACGFTSGGTPQSENWPPDLVETNSINVSDVLALKPVFGTAGTARLDIAPSGSINISDVLAVKPFFGKACTP